MNKFSLLALGVLIGLFSACSDDLYRSGASIAEGQAYFEENAVDLAPMHFPREPWLQHSRSAAEAVPELTPMWEQALSSSDGTQSIVEVPIYSRSKPFCTEEVIQNGEKLGKQITPGFRRLLVTTNEDGSKEMLLLTIVPDKEYSGDLEENPEDFCYLGGGDFSGKVFCSNLDGEYLYAWEYQNGIRQKLRTVNGFNLTVALWDDKPTDYTVIRFNEATKTSAGTYSYDETGGDIWWAGGGGGVGGGGGSHHSGGSLGDGNFNGGGYQDSYMRYGEDIREKMITDFSTSQARIDKAVFYDPYNPSSGCELMDAIDLRMDIVSITHQCIRWIGDLSRYTLRDFGMVWSGFGLPLSLAQTYCVFTDGDVTTSDVLTAISTALDVLGFVSCFIPVLMPLSGFITVTSCFIGLISRIFFSVIEPILLKIPAKGGNIYLYIPANAPLQA